jgi:hypothetical protein
MELGIFLRVTEYKKCEGGVRIPVVCYQLLMTR